jgi:hypothetical protein
MKRHILLLCLALSGAQTALAQEAAERFIPIGQSPGLSGVSTLMGTIRSIDPATGNVTIDLDQGGSKVVCVGPATRLWKDLSRKREPNCAAGLADLQPGLRVEARPVSGDPVHAEWVKVEGR